MDLLGTMERLCNTSRIKAVITHITEAIFILYMNIIVEFFSDILFVLCFPVAIVLFFLENTSMYKKCFCFILTISNCNVKKLVPHSDDHLCSFAGLYRSLVFWLVVVVLWPKIEHKVKSFCSQLKFCQQKVAIFSSSDKPIVRYLETN